MNHCATCGAPLPPSSQFCPRCGADLRQPAAVVPPAVAPPPVVASPPPAASSPAAPKQRAWWIVPLVIIGVVVIAFALLIAMPFGSREERPVRTEVAQTETIAEGEPEPRTPAETGTLIDVDSPEPAPAPAPTTTTVAPVVVPPVTTTTTTAAPAPQRSAPPPAAAADDPPKAAAKPASGEISEDEAVATLRGFLVTRNYYGTGAGCLRVAGEGYRNAGYTMSVYDSCAKRQLDRWRVDSKTREVFRQRGDGRFLRP